MRLAELWCSCRAAGNFNLDGPIYIDLAQHTSASGGQVWQIKDVYYGKFLVNNKPQPGHKLELIQ